MTGKKYVIFCIVMTIVLLGIFATTTYIIDPFFHYHKPYEWVSYKLSNQRYQNDGILKHFDYDAIITGTSMTENFKTSEFDKLFNVNSIKTSFSGATFKEINDNLEKAIKNNSDIKIIIRSLDLAKIFDDASKMRYDLGNYPWYLYDDYIYNDVEYVFNKSVFFDWVVPSILRSKNKIDSTKFDKYSSWYKKYTFSKETVDKKYTREKKKQTKELLTDEDLNIINENITKNIVEIARSNPNIDFYIFLPPYSIYYWDDQNQKGLLEREMDGLEYSIKLMINTSNIHVYSFINEYDIACDLNNYIDITHYSEKINSKMLIWMKEGRDLLTKDNYEKYMMEARKFYTEYDYDKLFEK